MKTLAFYFKTMSELTESMAAHTDMGEGYLHMSKGKKSAKRAARMA